MPELAAQGMPGGEAINVQLAAGAQPAPNAAVVKDDAAAADADDDASDDDDEDGDEIAGGTDDANVEWFTGGANDQTALPTDWMRRVQWALRTAIACAIGGWYATAGRMNNKEDDIGLLARGTVLAPVLAVVAVGPTVGATIRVARAFIRGTLAGALSAIAALRVGLLLVCGGAARSDCASFDSSGHDVACCVCFTLAALFLTSRPALSLGEKKVGGEEGRP